MTKGFFDGASRGNPGEAGAGALLYGDSGEILWESCLYLGRGTNNEAEYQGLLLLLEEVVRRDLREVTLYGDSKLVISQMQGLWKVRQPHLQELWKKAQTLGKGRDLKFAWVPREQNKEADALSNKALDEPARAMEIPSGFEEVLLDFAGDSQESEKKTSPKKREEVLFTKVAEHIYLARGGEEYAVDLLHGSCTCPGFQYRKKCRHLQEAKKKFLSVEEV